MPRTFVCTSDELPEGKGRWVKLLPGTEAYVFRLRGGVTGFMNRCTHMGGSIELNANKDQLCCRMHQATFDPQSGKRTSGQAPEGSALTAVQVEEKDGEVWATWSMPTDPFDL